MNGNFKVGEVCIGQNFNSYPEYNGMECVITGGLRMVAAKTFTGSKLAADHRYMVQWANGLVSVIRPFYIRRKQPPSGELSILNMFVVAPPQRTKEIA